MRRPRDGLFSLTRRRENFRPHNERWRYRRRERLLFTGEARKQGDRRLHRLRLDVLLTHTARGLPRRLQARGDLPDLLGGNGHDARRCAARDRGALHRADGHRSARERLRGDGAAQDVEVGDHTRRRAAGLRGLLEDLGDDDGAAHTGDGIRGADLDLFTRAHLLARGGEGELAGSELERRAAGYLGDGEHGALAHGHDGLAAEEHAGEGFVAGGDGVPQEHVVLELQGDGRGQGHAPRGDVAFEGRHHASLFQLGDRDGGREQGRDQQHREIATDHASTTPVTNGRR